MNNASAISVSPAPESASGGASVILRGGEPKCEGAAYMGEEHQVGREDLGTAYHVTGTVKEHGDYKGQKQTILSRCSLVQVGHEPPPPVKKKAPTAAEKRAARAERETKHWAHVHAAKANPPHRYGAADDACLVVMTQTAERYNTERWWAGWNILDSVKGRGADGVTIVVPDGTEWTWVKP